MRGRGRNRKMSMKEMERRERMVYLLAGNMEGSQDRNRSTLVFPVLYIYHILSSRLRKL
jgi:hypothetical protein